MFGENGILPAKNTLINESPKIFDKFNAKPTLLWISSEIGLNAEYMFDLLCLFGIAFAFLGWVLVLILNFFFLIICYFGHIKINILINHNY